MSETPDLFLDPDLVSNGLRTYYIGRRMAVVREIASTQDEVRRRAEEGEDEGFVLVAESQTAGRGRKGDRWFSPPGTGLYLSLLLRPHIEPIGLLPLALGLAAAQAIEGTSLHRPSLKWPNDLLLDDRKLGGIIAESQVQDGRVLYVVAGIGINLADPQGGWPPEIARRSISLGGSVRPEIVLAELLNAIESNYEHLQRGRGETVLGEYRTRCLQRGGIVVIVSSEDGTSEEVRAIEVESDGSLLVERPDGSQQRIYGQQVSVRGIPEPENSDRL